MHFISDGLNDDKSEKIYETLKSESNALKNKTILATYGVGDGGQ